MKLLFMDKHDIFNIWGQVRFGVTSFKKIADCESPGFSLASCRPQADGSYDVFGYVCGKMTPWKLFRSRTVDGINFENTHVVLERTDSKWQHVASVTYSPEKDMYLCMKNVGVDDGFDMYVFTSKNGEDWEEYDSNPVFSEGDRWGTIWSSALQKFVCYQKGIERIPRKPFLELLQDCRRVITIRTSPDGFHWTPDAPNAYQRGSVRLKNPISDKPGRLDKVGGPLVPVEYNVSPDELDPPDLEFYAGTPFVYEDRYFLVVLNYTGSFIPPGTPPVDERGHGPGTLDTELWISRDGFNWERPFRETDIGSTFVGHEPMLLDGQLAFRQPKALVGLPEDRITYATSRANGIFETKLFPAPKSPLKLNAKVPGEMYKYVTNEGYIMVELVDDCDKVIPGYEREKCIYQAPFDEHSKEISWKGKNGTELVDQRVRVRFISRASNIYAVTD